MEKYLPHKIINNKKYKIGWKWAGGKNWKRKSNGEKFRPMCECQVGLYLNIETSERPKFMKLAVMDDDKREIPVYYFACPVCFKLYD